MDKTSLKLSGVIGVILVLLSGCAARTPPAITSTASSAPSINETERLDQIKKLTNFYISGKVAFSDGKKGGTASLEWQQFGDRYSIVLIGALGSGTLAIHGDGGQVTLTTSEGETYTANTPEELIKKHLGWVMPISPLRHWLKGVDAPGQAPTRREWDLNHRLVLLEQQGWKIEYLSYTHVSGIDVPVKLQLENGAIRLRFIFRQWRF